MTKPESASYERGKKAFFRGVPMHDNPHHLASAGPERLYRAWERGWREAKVQFLANMGVYTQNILEIFSRILTVKREIEEGLKTAVEMRVSEKSMNAMAGDLGLNAWDVASWLDKETSGAHLLHQERDGTFVYIKRSQLAEEARAELDEFEKAMSDV